MSTNQSFNFIVHDDKIRIYYGGNGWRDPLHVPLDWASDHSGLDGFVSMETPAPVKKMNGPVREGTLLTKPLWSTGIVWSSTRRRTNISRQADRSRRASHPRIRTGRLRTLHGRQHPSYAYLEGTRRYGGTCFRCGSGSGCETRVVFTAGCKRLNHENQEAIMDWVEVPASEDIKNIGTRKQLFLDDEIIETHRWVTPQADKSAALLVETAEETGARVDAEKSKGTDVPWAFRARAGRYTARLPDTARAGKTP